MHECPSCADHQGFFSSLSKAHLEILQRHRDAHTYGPGQVIFYEGTPALAVYCVHSGLVKLYKTDDGEKETMIRLLRPGDIAGYRAVISDELFAATAEAVEDTTVCTVPRDTFLQLLRDDRKLSLDMMARLARELRVSEDEMMFRLHRPVSQRTAHLLLLLADEPGPDGKRHPSVVLPVKREELARMIGTTPETLSRTLHDFARRGILDLSRRRIDIRDLRALRRAASADRT
jgi:CRP-like cAMP-binding protein